MHRLVAGMTFGRLTVLGPAPDEPRFHGCRGWRCRCECGRQTVALSRNLVKGISRSCGCLTRDVTAARNRTHGQTGTREYRAWQDAKRRCHDPRRSDYARYGGKGIRMCREWRDSFETFLRDVGPCPPGLTIDRIDSARGYEPGNVRWAGAVEQSNNRLGQVRPITFQGRTMNLAQWERTMHFPDGTLKRRLHRGWTVERALTTPVR